MDRREPLQLLHEAIVTFGPSSVLEEERAIHRRASGLAEAAVPLPSHAASPAPRSAWEHYALGRALLVSGDLKRAAQELAAALELEPAGRWPNFYYGLCAYRLGRHEDAVAAFSVCIGTAPSVAGYFYNRALAYAALGRPSQAMRDYDRVLQIDPTHAAAALNRGVLYMQQHQLDQALTDLRCALEHGADPATVHFDLALINVAANDRAAALLNVQEALLCNPAHESARQLRDTLENRLPISEGGQ
jgi:tetratricopeptide (TPR) repeat protein